MIQCRITDFFPACTACTQRKASCVARFSLVLCVDGAEIVELRHCTLRYGQLTDSYYIGWPAYKKGAQFDEVARVLSPEVKAEIVAEAVRLLGHPM